MNKTTKDLQEYIQEYLQNIQNIFKIYTKHTTYQQKQQGTKQKSEPGIRKLEH